MRDDRIPAIKGLILFVVLFLFAAGCTGPLNFTYAPMNGTPVTKVEGRPSVLIRPFDDERPAEFRNPRTIGKVTSTVIDMNSREITLSEDVTAVAEKAFAKELGNAGFVVVSGDPALTNSDYVLSGVVKDFRLDVGPRDTVSVSVMTKLIEKNTGAVVWSDTASEKREDYIGIWGETKSHISRYLSNALAKVARTAIAGFEAKISAPAGVTVEQPPAPEKPPAEISPAPGAVKITGKLTIATDPTRAEIYVEDVYYGLAPLTMDMKPGIYEVTAKKKGFMDARKKVSVREGQTTELDMTLGKE